MRTALILALLISSLALAGEPRVFGAAMPAGEALGIAAAIDGGVQAAPAKFAGRITQVCQAKGCWLILEDNGRHARVRTRDHAYFLPKDASGRALVFGSLSEVELKPEMAKHLAEDAGQSEPVAPREHQILADSIALLD